MKTFWANISSGKLWLAIDLSTFSILFFSTALNLSDVSKWLLLTIYIAVKINIYAKNNAELKAALYYARTKSSISKIVKSVILILSIIGLLYVIAQYFAIPAPVHVQFYLAMIASAIFNYTHADFLASVRAFKQGLKWPGRNKRIIPWDEIKSLRMEASEMVIVCNETLSVTINEKDFEQTEGIINTWHNYAALHTERA